MLKFFRKIYLPIAWMVFIHILLLIPGKNLQEESLLEIPHMDKIIHFGFYLLLVGCWVLYYNQNEELSQQQKKLRGILLVFLAIADGVAIEFLQRLEFIHRDFSWFDVLFDSIGAFTGWLTANYFTLKQDKKRKPLWKQGP